MRDELECTFCGTPLDPVQVFVFLVEFQHLDDARRLEQIRRLPHASGIPLMICRDCQEGVEANERALIADEQFGRQRVRGCFLLLLMIAFLIVLMIGLCRVWSAP